MKSLMISKDLKKLHINSISSFRYFSCEEPMSNLIALAKASPYQNLMPILIYFVLYIFLSLLIMYCTFCIDDVANFCYPAYNILF